MLVVQLHILLYQMCVDLPFRFLSEKKFCFLFYLFFFKGEVEIKRFRKQTFLKHPQTLMCWTFAKSSFSMC